MKIALPVFAAVALLSAHGAYAHGIWTEQRYGQLEVVYGHGAEDLAYAADKVKGAWAYEARGQMIPVTVEKLGDHARLHPEKPPAVLAVALDNGVWSKNAQGESVNKAMADVPGAVSASHSYKYSLAILDAHAQVPAALKLAMVIRPLKDPSDVGVGNRLPVEVTIDGKPAAGIALLDDYRGLSDVSSVVTDAQGRASVTVRNAGLNVIAAQAKVPAVDRKDISERSLFTSLTFVGKAHQH
ncbi:DUF4198 domain-containing protein [Pseudomonas putida]|nr:DUF4198 domain-containing protein [Pseudomonas putida]